MVIDNRVGAGRSDATKDNVIRVNSEPIYGTTLYLEHVDMQNFVNSL